MQTTANDMLKFMSWHLKRSQDGFQGVRLLDHAAWLYRDGLDPVVGMDEAGSMDAMGLGWVIMLPRGDRPLILQKTGGLQGMLAYVALAPSRGVGVFAAMNEFNFASVGRWALVREPMGFDQIYDRFRGPIPALPQALPAAGAFCLQSKWPKPMNRPASEAPSAPRCFSQNIASPVTSLNDISGPCHRDLSDALLKAIADIYEPTAGSILTTGKITARIGVAAGIVMIASIRRN